MKIKRVLTLAFIMMISSVTVAQAAVQDVYGGQEAIGTMGVIAEVPPDIGFGVNRFRVTSSVSFYSKKWDEFWENSIAKGGSYYESRKKELESAMAQDKDQYDWIYYDIDTPEGNLVAEDIQGQLTVSSEYMDTPWGQPLNGYMIWDTSLMIDEVNVEDCVFRDGGFMYNNGRFFTATIDGVTYDRCFMIGIKDSSCLLRFPKAVKRVTVEYVPNDQHWSSATNWVRTNIPRPEDKLILHIVDRGVVPLNNLSMWKQDAKGWRVENPDGTYLTNQWFESNGKWYYMGADGYMLINTTTPDGYTVNADGVWVQ